MPTFIYNGADANGESVTEVVTAEDRYAVYEIARQNGHVVKDVTEQSRFSLTQFIDVEKINYYISWVSLDELVLASRNLGAMLRAGLPLSRALSVLERQTKNPRLKGVMVQLRERVNGGDQLFEAMQDHPATFDDLYVSMVRAGEEGGNLADSLNVLATQLKRSSDLKKKVKGAMIYPAIVISIMVGIGFLMMIFVMPSLTATFENMDIELPASTQLFISISNFINNQLLLTLGLLFGSLLSLYLFMRTKVGQIIFHWLYIKAPVIGTITKETNAARTARTLSSLLTSGVDMVRALDITAEVVQNRYYRAVITQAGEGVQTGQPLSESFIERSDIFPILVGEMIAVGEETGQISNMMLELAEFYEQEVENKTDNLSTIIEPLLMVVIGGGVGFFAMAMLSPIYSIGQGF